MNGATMVKEGGLYKILPSAVAVRGNVTPQLGNSQRALPPGFSVQIVPLRYIGTREMMRILEPLAKDATAIRPDDLRNLLILSGTERELRHLLETIDLFDVDWIAGMSVGLFTLQNADVKAVGQELDKIVGDRNTEPARRHPAHHPDRADERAARDHAAARVPRGGEEVDRAARPGRRRRRSALLRLQPAEPARGEARSAADAGVHRTRGPGDARPPPPTLAPGTPAGTIVSPPTFQAQTRRPRRRRRRSRSTRRRRAPVAQAIARAAEGIGIVRNIQVVADKDNNTLLIVATAPEYTVIEAALKKLDVPARQVAIEVTIASVTLTDELDFGVEWLFKGGAPSGRGAGGLITRSTPFNPGAIPQNPNNPGLGLAQGFTYIIQNANFPGGVQAVLHLLDTYGDTKVVANPHLAALDNQKATIKAGNKIPINQQSFVGSGVNAATNVVTTTSQYIDTGVLLQVTPHINAGGLVTLDVQAEVSDPGHPVAELQAMRRRSTRAPCRRSSACSPDRRW